MADVSVWQVVGTVAVGVITGVTGYLTAARAAQSKDREVERDLSTMARQMVDEAVRDLRAELREVRDERRRDARNFERLRKKWNDLHSGLLRLRAAFEASDIHLSTYLNLARTNPKQAERYLANLEADREAFQRIVSDLCETSEPVMEGDDAPSGIRPAAKGADHAS